VNARQRVVAVLAGALLVLATAAGCTSGPDAPSGRSSAPPLGTSAPKLHVAGARIVDDSGAEVRLLGVNRSGSEFECVNGGSIWDGPVDDDAVAAIASWRARAVRIALNEDCWLGVGQVHPSSSGDAYRQAVAGYVSRLEAHGIVAILDLHWTDGTWTGKASQCGDQTAKCQKPMPDAEHAPAFWTSVAQTFAGDRSVVFDLFNEAYPNATATMSADRSWECWLHGGDSCAGLPYRAAGMQQLVDAVRGTGARNVILVGGNGYANDLSRWLEHRPTDPTGNLGAAWHSYSYDSCTDAACWARQVLPVAAEVPVVVAEVGQTGCGTGYVTPLMNWLDRHNISYLGWTWNTWDCSGGPALITDYDGTPTAYGAAVRARLLAY
jgi:endoglucanase